MVYKLYPKIYHCVKYIGYAHCKGLRIWPTVYMTIVHNLMNYSNKCQLHCMCEQLAGGKRSCMVCESLNLETINDGYDKT